jgi:hypothetical protein
MTHSFNPGHAAAFRRRASAFLSAAGVCLLTLAACEPRVNPSFPLTVGQASEALRRMEASPRPFDRPVVVLAGIFDPGFASDSIRRRLERITSDPEQVISVAFIGADDFDACRERVIEQVESAWPSDDPAATVEVDVVAVSMGGLVARYASRPLHGDGKRLNVSRLFTLGTPHLGAKLAGNRLAGGQLSVDMAPGSAFISVLNRHTRDDDPAITPYVRLGDGIVGDGFAAPPGEEAIWVATPPLEFSHMMIAFEERFLADIAARLRSEAPLALDGAAASSR